MKTLQEILESIAENEYTMKHLTKAEMAVLRAYILQKLKEKEENDK